MTRLGARPARAAGKAPEDRATLTARRFLRRRRARRWLVWRRLLVALALLALSVGATWLVLFSSVLASGGAAVTGTESLSEELVVETAAVPIGVPLARLDLDAIQARVEGLVAVDSADVSRDWPDRVHIDVTERTPVAAALWEDSWHGLDEGGVLFREYDRRPADLPVVRMRAATPVEALAEGAAVVDALPEELLRRVVEFEVGSIDDISFRLRDGAEVVWGSAEHSEAKVEVLSILLRRPAQTYDVSAPGRPTTRG